MALPVAALTVVASAAVLVVALRAVVTTVALQPVVKVVVSAAVTTVVVTVGLPLAATAKAMAASPALVMPVVVVLPPVAMQAHRAVISRHASLLSPSPQAAVVVPSLLWPTMRASVPHAPHAD